MRRRYIIALIGVGVVLFLVISGLLARAFSVSGAEQAAITNLVQDEAGGNTAGVMALISGCGHSPSCRAHAAALARSLRRAGRISIIQLNASSNFSLGPTLGTARVAWLVGGSLPRVQCVRVRHAGNVLEGFQVQLLAVTDRLASDADCPTRF